MRSDAEIDGALVVDKPAGPTSHDIVELARRSIGCKVGHAGTLDPAATGVLVLLLGQATRLSRFLQASDKEYVALVRLGIATDTYDAQGRVIEERDVPPLSAAEAEVALARFRGSILQVPPMYSAVKIAGEPLYKAARRDEEVIRPARPVTVHQMTLEEQQKETWRLRIVCSSGTYVRSIAHELGQSIGCGARLERLRRVRSGEFSIERSIPPESFETGWSGGFVPIDHLLSEFPEIALGPESARLVANGNPLPAAGDSGSTAAGYVRLTHNGHLVAVGEADASALKPRVVLRATATL